jgi:hypothetical protein
MNEFFKQNIDPFSSNPISSESSLSDKVNHLNSNENKFYQDLNNHENFIQHNTTNKNTFLLSSPTKQSNSKFITQFCDEYSNYDTTLNKSSVCSQFFMPNTNNHYTNTNQFSSYENQLSYPLTCSNQLKEINCSNTPGSYFSYDQSYQISSSEANEFNSKQFDRISFSSNSLNKIRNMVLNQQNDASDKSQIIDTNFKNEESHLNKYQTYKTYETNMVSSIPENSSNYFNEDSKNEIFKNDDSNLDISSSESNKSSQMYPWMKRVHGNNSGYF